MNKLTEAGTLHCANCGALLQGEYCHACGQSVHSVLKPVHHMAEDALDMVLHVDGRIVHTLPPLLLKPGFLTLEYFAGRRQRYVAPFRLMFVLCLLAFFALHAAVDMGVERAVRNTAQARAQVDRDAFAGDDTAAEVRSDLADQLTGLTAARRTMPAFAPSLDASERAYRQLANQRLAQLGEPPLPADFTAPAAAPAPRASGAPGIHPAPVHDRARLDLRVSWLPAWANRRLDGLAGHIRTNLDAMGDADRAKRQAAMARIITGIFSLLPQAMVVMVPVFAGLLKLFYLFRRRLYMEHLIVALHSHAFLFLALLLFGLLGLAATWAGPDVGWAGTGLDYVGSAVLLWMPAYLLIMQKRVYRQGWPMTLLKYWCIGWSYFWLLLLVVAVTVVLGAGH